VQKRQDEEKYGEYLQLAEKVRRDSEPWGYGFTKSMQVIALGLAKLVLFLVGGFGLVVSITSGSHFVQNLIATVILVLAFGGVVGMLKLGIRLELSRISKRSKKKVAKISQTKPDFLPFYQGWESKKSAQELKDILAASNGVALAAGLVTAASLANDSAKTRKEEQIRNAVDDELRRRGID
jgi:hypothetical protein